MKTLTYKLEYHIMCEPITNKRFNLCYTPQCVWKYVTSLHRLRNLLQQKPTDIYMLDTHLLSIIGALDAFDFPKDSPTHIT